MGAAIDACASFDGHRELSASLEGFASSTSKTIGAHDGRLVYAGGDDVLAFVPLHRVLPSVVKLAADFADAMAKWPVIVDGVERSPTLSVGVAVVHHLLRLDEALDLVRRAEQRAKGVRGKNGLAISVKPRGGDAVEVAAPLGTLAARIAELVGMHRRAEISARAQYELMDLHTRAAGAGDAQLATTLDAVVQAEARRILARKQSRRGQDAKLADEVLARLGHLGAYEDPSRLGRELYVAHELARAEEQASPAAAESRS